MAAKQTKSRSSNSTGQKGTKNKKSTSAKQTVQTTKKKRSSNERSKNNEKLIREEQETLIDEVILVITLLVSLLLILSYINLCGPIGNGINFVVFGLFGILAYIFPFALFFMVAFSLSNRGNRIAKQKLYSGIALLFIISSMIQLFSGYDKEVNWLSYFEISANHKTGGGLIGGTLVKIFCPLFGTIATAVILIALFVICFMLITGKALLSYLAKLGSESIEYHREQRALREQEEYDMDEEDEYYERRRPRVVTLQKHGKQFEEEDEIEDDEEESRPISFLERLKQKGKETHKSSVGDDSFASFNEEQTMSYDMKEVTDGSDSEFSITGNYIPSDSMISEVNAIYEDELHRKFGSKSESHDDNIKDNIQCNIANNVQSMDVNTAVFETKGRNIDEGSFVNEFEDTSFDKVHQSEATLNKEKDMKANEPMESHSAPAKNRSTKQGEASSEEPLSINQVMEEQKKYEFPPLNLLAMPKNGQKGMTDKDLKETAMKLQKTLESFGVRVTITNISCGPAVTRYELQPEQGVKVSKITGLADDIKLNLAAADVRIEAPIPGKAAVGIEVPNKENTAVMLRELLDTKEFKNHSSDIAFAVGKDIGGQAVVTDIAKMPHLLIAGATGSGKSVCINTLIMSILYKANPADVRMIMVDPKVVELSVYNGIPHLLIPVVTDPKKASAALNWAVMEMTERYKKFADLGVRDLKGYNEKVAEIKELNDPKYQKLPQIIIIVDELADLMMVAPGEVEDAICRLAQMARAAGLHLIIATQRPSVNVITGLIKANVPSRIAFSVSSAIDSRTIIDGSGAEKLLGKGDMLFFPSGYPKPVRVQGAFVSDKEVSAVVDFLKEQNINVSYSEDVTNQITSVQSSIESGASGSSSDRDEYFIEAGKFIIEKDKASIGMLQRVYKIGFNRAARIMDQLSEAGVVGPEEGTKPRKVLMSLEEFEQYIDEYV